MQIRVIVQDGRRLIREGIALFLEGEPDVELIGCAETAADVVRLCGSTPRPDAVVIAIDADEWDACRLVAALRKRYRALRVVGLHDELSRELATRASQAGVHALVARSEGMAPVMAALRARSRLAPKIIGLPPPPVEAPHGGLTPRERSVLLLVSTGATTREISEVLAISPKTVENHKQRIFAKLGVQNQAHAVSVAMRSGLLPTAGQAG